MDTRAKRHRWLLVLLVAVVYALHQDVWNWHRIEPLVFGFLPAGLAYHAGYSVLAPFTIWVLVRLAWPKHLEKPSEAPKPPPAGAP
jgi:hypothetical protein